MKIKILVLSALVLSGCGTVRDSALNPFNWFGRSKSEPVATVQEDVNPLIPRRRDSIFRSEGEAAYGGGLIGEVSELLVERRPGGAIIRATGIADRQGPFELRLVKVDDESDATTLTYDLRAYQQPGATGTARSRTVTTAIWLTDNELAGIRTIRVKGARNQRSTRR
jgi:hypothetical protein